MVKCRNRHQQDEQKSFLNFCINKYTTQQIHDKHQWWWYTEPLLLSVDKVKKEVKLIRVCIKCGCKIQLEIVLNLNCHKWTNTEQPPHNLPHFLPLSFIMLLLNILSQFYHPLRIFTRCVCLDLSFIVLILFHLRKEAEKGCNCVWF